jgi:hypothetical protein
MRFCMQVKTPKDEWVDVRPSGGSRYEYATEEQAKNMLAICYPDELRNGRLGRESRARVVRQMFALTFVNRDGVRTLMKANQGRHHFDEREAAQAALDALVANNKRETLAEVWGEQAVDTLAVREVACYAHGDAIGIFFDE